MDHEDYDANYFDNGEGDDDEGGDEGGGGGAFLLLIVFSIFCVSRLRYSRLLSFASHYPVPLRASSLTSTRLHLGDPPAGGAGLGGRGVLPIAYLIVCFEGSG